MSPRPSGTVVAVNTVMLWLATVVAASALWPIYASSAFLVMVAVALAVGTLIAILGAIFRWPAFVVMLTTVVGFFAVGVPVAVPSKTQFGTILLLPISIVLLVLKHSVILSVLHRMRKR